MKTRIVIATLAAAVAVPSLAFAQFEQFRGKMKEGLYEYKMDMDMGQVPGMPAGMGKQSHTFQHCVTAQDIEKGTVGNSRENRMPENCQVKDFKMSGDTATYKMACKGSSNGKGPPMDMSSDNRITFRDTGYTMDMKMAMDHGGQQMNMNQHMEGRYLGPCNGKK